jgi:hypothetical protein
VHHIQDTNLLLRSSFLRAAFKFRLCVADPFLCRPCPSVPHRCAIGSDPGLFNPIAWFTIYTVYGFLTRTTVPLRLVHRFSTQVWSRYERDS